MMDRDSSPMLKSLGLVLPLWCQVRDMASTPRLTVFPGPERGKDSRPWTSCGFRWQYKLKDPQILQQSQTYISQKFKVSSENHAIP